MINFCSFFFFLQTFADSMIFTYRYILYPVVYNTSLNNNECVILVGLLRLQSKTSKLSKFIKSHFCSTGVPMDADEIIKVVQRFAYVKETSYGVTFDVVNEPDPEAHLAFTGVHLDHHTDMNYREKSPGTYNKQK